MGVEHNPETVWRAQELYCVDRLSFKQIATRLGLADSTLRRWADNFKWKEKRNEIAEAESEIRINQIRSRRAIIQKLLEAENGKEASQLAFAVASLERLAIEQEKISQQAPLPHNERIEITNKKEAINALKVAIDQKLYVCLADPNALTLSTVKEIIASLNLVDTLETTEPETQDDRKGLSSDIAKKLNEILGLS